MLKERGINEIYYQAFHPLVKIRGLIHKMHRSKLTSYLRYVYLNPIEGVFTMYKAANKYPHMPNVIVHLNQIKRVTSTSESKWYTSRNRFYFIVET